MKKFDFMKLGYSKTEVCNAIDEYILNDRYRKMMKRRHCDGAHYDTIAEEFCLSEGRVKEIICKCNRTLKTQLNIT